ncbi:MAG: IreB family regulatory phosphoprotein [Solobacterium sp.]|nr:IreB family regulatory phosphoprotein [Solobacterium sp.]
MSNIDISPTVSFDADQIRRENIRQVLMLVRSALEERGYNSINQLAGYLISNDPAYISSHKNARSIIQSVERHEIIEELVRFYLEENNAE